MALSGVGAGSTALILMTTEPYDSPAFQLWKGFHFCLMIGAVIIFLTDLILKIVTRKGRLAPLDYIWWHAWLRAALVWMGILSNWSSTLEYWLCVNAPDRHLRQRCFSSVASGNISYIFFCAVLQLPFLNYVFMLMLAPLGETIIGQIPTLRLGQPAEDRWTRPAIVAGLACVTFPVLLWTERESRNRFINLKHLESKRAFHLMRKQQIAAALRGLCDPAHLSLLLAGQKVQHESTDAGVLISQVNDFTHWRQQQLPLTALKLLGLIWDLVESKRADLEKSTSVRMERLWSKGDSLALAVGISKPATEEQLKSLLRFATWQHFLSSIIAKRRVAPSFAFRFGLGRGACYALILPGATITRLPIADLAEVESDRTHNSSHTITTASSSKTSNGHWLTYMIQEVLCGTISPEMDAFLNQTALQRVHLVSANKLSIAVTLAAVTLVDGSWTPASTVLFFFIACLSQLTPRLIVSCFPHRARVGVPIVANLTMGMACCAIFLANESIVNRNPDWLAVICPMTTLVATDGIAPINAVAVSIFWFLLYVILTVTLPLGIGRHELKDGL
jgi:hypothetical protein